MKIIVIGSMNMDMVMQTSRIPEVGETINGEGFFLSGGGKGANQAVACAKMGADTWMMAKVGDDIFGQSLLDDLSNYGVQTDFIVKEAGISTGVASITVKDGNNSIILASGANSCLLPEDIRKLESELLSASAIMLQLEIPIETVYEVISVVKGKVPIFLNPAPALPLDDYILQGIHYFTPNEIECRLYTGVEIHTIDDAFTALDVLRNKGIMYPLITLGEQGVAYYNGSNNVHRSGLKVNAIDTTAAGDTFSGTLAAMIVAGQTMDEAVSMAIQASALSVTRLGAQQSIPLLAEMTN
ncbi:ribokinase [Paenibacillus endoradicis]|uniref:ribokinase n=1 Tax=Paenibacillus endoradicis TaxID=2972487 RepID=UPI00215946FC|nr:ribokinase [Paenibacillus endoradicis]MCR8655798.1 ribokinase [Paenibacillus endoradicis]MCR8658124.1 ribokinase [Paenibacillus endoradicis]